MEPSKGDFQKGTFKSNSDEREKPYSSFWY